jgi:thymidine kinase
MAMKRQNNPTTAYLELIVGPMFSGKTSRLVEIYEQCIKCSIPVAVINHSFDTRYGNNIMSTHNRTSVPCVMTNDLKHVWTGQPETNAMFQLLRDRETVFFADVILINEGQFFDDLFEIVSDMLTHGKHIYVCGLDGDFQQKKFGQILDLIPICDKITKLTSFCGLCKNGTVGIFSKRLTFEQQQTVIGSSNYIPVCRKCVTNN